MRHNHDITTALAALASIEPRSWLVGGAVRDRLLGRATSDYDVAVDGDVSQAARGVARAMRARAFELSEGFGAWRVVSRIRAPAAQAESERARWQLDLLPVAGESIEDDLGLRDLTVNALAQQLGTEELVDPFGGLNDLAERRLRMVSAEAFRRDPLRTLRVARLAGDLGFIVELKTADEARRQAGELAGVSPERVFEEVKRILRAADPLRGIRLMDELGITAVVLPELWALRGIEQSRYHHLDVHAHTLAVLAETVELERAPAEHLGPSWEAVDAFLATPLANELTRWQTLRLGALLHDIAKPQTRGVSAEGRVAFFGHDAVGAQTAASILSRLRTSERLREHVAALVRNHLRLGFLVHDMPLSRRAIYRYLRECEPVAVDVTVLSVADRLATRGDRSEEAISRHLRLAHQMLTEALAWSAKPPRPPVRGHELVTALGLAPGPALGRLLAELEEASFAQEIASREEAIERARELLRPRAGSEDR